MSLLQHIEVMGNVYIIAEVGVNHNGDKNLAYRLIDLAKEAGADAVKFQHFYPELLCSTVYRKEEMNMLKEYMLTPETLKELQAYTLKNKLDFIVTPFDFKSLEEIVSLSNVIIKIGSGELTHIPLLKKAASFENDLIISTGAATMSDVERAVNEIENIKKDSIGILHCISAYPAPDESLNLRNIITLKKTFPNHIIGYSDHSLGSVASNLAVALDCKIIEKHITLDKKLNGPDHCASADQYDFTDMINTIRKAEIMLGDYTKMPQKCEGIIGRSIVAKKKIKAGEILDEAAIDYKRPGNGIRPYDVSKLLGCVVQNDIGKDELIRWQDLKKQENQ
jgi:N-acetylneuraminate synthase